MKSTHKYRQIQTKKCKHSKIQNTAETRRNLISQDFHCSGFLRRSIWEETIPTLCARADVRWLGGLCSLTVGTDYQQRGTPLTKGTNQHQNKNKNQHQNQNQHQNKNQNQSQNQHQNKVCRRQQHWEIRTIWGESGNSEGIETNFHFDRLLMVDGWSLVCRLEK